MAIGQRFVSLGNFDGSITAGGTIQFNPPRKNTYNAIYLKLLNNSGNKLTKAQIEDAIMDVECIINGDQKIKLPAKFLIAIFEARTGLTCPNGYIPILFANDKYVSFEQKVLSSWGMADVTSFQIYVNLGTTLYNLDVVKVYADITPVEAPIGLHQCYTYQTSGIIPQGELDCTTLATFGADARLQALYVNNPTAGMTQEILITNEYLEVNGVIMLRQNIDHFDCEIANMAYGNEVPTILGSAFRFDSGDDIRTTLAMSTINQMRYRAMCDLNGYTSPYVLTFVYEFLRGYTSTEKKLQTA